MNAGRTVVRYTRAAAEVADAAWSTVRFTCLECGHAWEDAVCDPAAHAPLPPAAVASLVRYWAGFWRVNARCRPAPACAASSGAARRPLS